MNYHTPVMPDDVVNTLMTDAGGIYVDCTVGGGGHSRLIAARLDARGRLIGCDRDQEAITQAKAVLPASVELIQCRFSGIPARLKKSGIREVTGVLFDLGVSSHQLDSAERGFSFRFDGPLDLRMDPTSGRTAAELLTALSEPELLKLIRDYGEDSQAKRIARGIVRERAQKAIRTTSDLEQVISKTVPATKIKSLARVFQALRIAVNDEMAELESGLQAAWDLLKPGGRIVVISYHSLEDRPVKIFFKSKSDRQTSGAPLSPLSISLPPVGRLLMRKPLTPGIAEIESNPRARSAKLRAIEKLQ
jgi:16S rRNA (cytosine1402-N4)-methyltransferase